MSAPVRMEPSLCRCDRPWQRCMLHCVRIRGDVRGVCPILVLVNRLQKEHPA